VTDDLQVQNAADEPAANTGDEDTAAFDAAWDRITGPERDDAGRFAGKQDGDEDGAPARGVPDGAEGHEEGQQAPADQEAPKVSLPANMTPDMADIFDGMAPEKSAKLTAWADKMHRQMSDQGRQIASYKPISDVISRNPEFFAHDQAIPPAEAFSRLLNAQRRLEADPIGGLRWLAENYGVTDQVFGGNAMSNEAAQLRQTITELRSHIEQLGNPAAIRNEVHSVLQAKTAEDAVSRFIDSKPLYADVEAVMPDFVVTAKRMLGENAQPMAILEKAYDMAVHAMPETRSKLAASSKAAVEADKRGEAAKKATSVNVKGSPGQRGPMTEDQSMEDAWNRLMSKS
jgi:hypothetical protein